MSDATARMQVSDRPWAVGVTPERQEAALKHLQEGNSLLKESLFVEAAKAYREALTAWDHPGIHYNLALALLNMDQPVEVYQNLQSAIKYGAEPLDPEKLEHAKSYLRLIEKQVATVEIRCDIAGAQVTFDGAPLFRAPGRYQGLVRAGVHTVTASKPGFTTTSLTEDLTSDKPTTLQLKLYTSGELIGYRRRYPIWRPLAVAGFGGALLVTGVVMSLQAQKYYNAFDDSARARCVNPVERSRQAGLRDEQPRLSRAQRPQAARQHLPDPGDDLLRGGRLDRGRRPGAVAAGSVDPLSRRSRGGASRSGERAVVPGAGRRRGDGGPGRRRELLGGRARLESLDRRACARAVRRRVVVAGRLPGAQERDLSVGAGLSVALHLRRRPGHLHPGRLRQRREGDG